MQGLKGFKGLAKFSRILGLVGLALLSTVPAHADSVTTAPEDGFVRLDFNFTTPAQLKAAADNGVLTLSFDRKVTLDPQTIMGLSNGAIASGHADASGKVLRFALNQPVRMHQSQLDSHAVVDLAPQDFKGAMPDLVAPPKPKPKPIDVAALPEIKLRAGSYANFTRLVFDWPHDVTYQVFPGAGKMTVRFETPVRLDVSAISRFNPPWVKNAAWHLDGSATVAEFETDTDSGYHDFKDGTHVVLDVLSPKTDTTAYAPPGTEKPQATAIKAITNAQAQAIIATADQVNGKKTPSPPPAPAPTPADTKTAKAAADAKKPDAKIDAAGKNADAKKADIKKADIKQADSKPADTKQAAAKPADTVPATPAALDEVQVTDSHLTPHGAVVVFKGGGAKPNAIFIRGMTAWVVLENAPAFNSNQLTQQLGPFAAGLEASSGNGMSILRVTLKQPAKIVAQSNGPDLKVTISADANASPITISFARNQDDPRRSSLTTLVPGANEVLELTDPIIGDVLTVVPGNAGRAVPAERDYGEFAALPTASGVVLTSYVDDLSVKVANARLAITRPGGLSLTPPSMPSAETPAALASVDASPDFLDFAAWGPLTGGSFLATERRLIQSAARLEPAKATRARLTLARFYLANHFAAEAMGWINLIQASDPGLRGDAQLTTMRAAADYMMGRYRDAHNDLAGASFDSDRHAALWRGLTESASGNWKEAHTYLEEAGPILKKYQPEWQAKAHLADAQAALGMGRLELADAALTRLPTTLTKDQTLEAELDRGRILATESRYRAAARQFVEVENGGNEKLTAAAIFYQTSAALNAGAVTPKEGTEILERLRFRWRGDQTEMQTVRKLASLYFEQKKWESGLKTLRVATENFSGDDARAAQDDMRAAFANLYLKGGADKLPPVESLAMFYDNIDLTPIGADGDEMIRRMVDRLVAVDLLGPAANLLSYQVTKRLDGVAKAEVSTKLAAIYLMDHKPQQAVDALHGAEISGLPDPDNHARMILEARAFAALKQWDNALDLIAVDDQPDTRRLRADIYWESGNWEVAGQKAEELLGASWSEPTPLPDNDRILVLRMAVAYSLASDGDSLDRLRQHFAPKMQNTTDAKAFGVLSQQIDMHGVAFRDAAARIASVDTLQAFMKDFGKKHS
jgi:tetratricopeptide (TPR) repeat protein